ncbi:MAG: ATP-binding cassette domain-containing protein [Lentisphaerales bacterium]|nr:ATP-binding cassette domain-containing protein [Lentisphaerales bacterium]
MTIFDNASLTIHENDRVGIVGRNGAGKSTLLKIIAEVEAPSSGDISKKKNLRISYLPQDFELDEDASVQQNILNGTADILAMIEEYESLDPASGKAAQLEQQITHLDGWNLEQEAKVLMQSIGTPSADQKAGELSGGEKRRVAMCKALISRPEFLILDEPTNHLDTESIEWLEIFLNRFQGALLLVTHDRYFLDRVSTQIFEVEAGRIQQYPGNYSKYLLQKADEMAAAEVVEHKRQQHLKKELAWVRAGVKARTTKSKSRLQRYHDEAKKGDLKKEIDLELIIPTAPILGNKTVHLENVSKGFEGKTLFEDLNLEFEPDTRIGIVGRNGLGKTTLVNIILGNLEPDRGTVEIGQRTQFNYVDQNRLHLDPEKSVLEEMSEGNDFVIVGEEKISVRGYLRRFQFTDQKINTKISRLSGGERNRLLLAKILKRGGNFIILDEPTNDLDLQTLRMLEEALLHFAGCVILISHDRYFLNRVCHGILAFEGNGQLTYQEGDYDYYLEKRQERQAQEEVAKVEKAKPKAVPKAQAKRKLKWKEERELETMEETILEKETEAEELNELFNQPDFYTKHGDDAVELTEKLENLKKEIETLYARWEELEEIKAESES